MVICMAIDKRRVLPMRAGRRSATVTETYASHARALSHKQADRQTNRETDIWSHLRRKHFREARKSVSRAKLISSKHNNVNVI